MIRIIVATDVYNGIAKNNEIPWTLKQDLAFFKETTTYCPSNKINAVIMGRKTHEAMNKKVLPRRLNIVLTSQGDYKADGVIVQPDLLNAIGYCNRLPNIHHIYIIGGQQVYEETLYVLPVDYIYKTVLHSMYDCDRFFPDISKDFELVSTSPTYCENNILFHIEIWRKSPVCTPPKK